MHDARGNRIEVGWFVAGREPHTFCGCHVLCEREVTHENRDPLEDGEEYEDETPRRELVALLRIRRRLPIAVEIADAPYVLPPEKTE